MLKALKLLMAKKGFLPTLLSAFLAVVSTVGSVLLTFAIWTGSSTSQPIVTATFNASEDDFTFYACVPNVSSDGGYDYYPLDAVPDVLKSSITGLAMAKYEAFNETVYIPAYPEVTIGTTTYNSNGNEDLPVIDILDGYYSSADTLGSNGIAKNSSIKYLIIPETAHHIYAGAFASMPNLEQVTFLGTTNYYYKLHLTNYKSLANIKLWTTSQDKATEEPVDELIRSTNNTYYYSKNDLNTYKVNLEGTSGNDCYIWYKSAGTAMQFTDSEDITFTALTLGKNANDESYYTYSSSLYIEPGVFTNDAGTTNISIDRNITSYTLGTGHSVDFIFQDPDRIANGTGFRFETTNLFMNQHSYSGATGGQGHFIYVGKDDSYTATFIPKTTITSFTVTNNITNESTTYPVSFKPYTKYTLKLTKSAYNTATDTSYVLSYTEYTYNLTYTLGGVKQNVDLSLNQSNTSIEEYRYMMDLGGVYPSDLTAWENATDYTVGVGQTAVHDPVSMGVFDLGWTNAYYNHDSTQFDITFSPNRVYQSTHYYSENDDDLYAKTTQLRINAEKVYYLNEVTKYTDGEEGNEKITVTFNNPDNWETAYITAYSIVDTSNGKIYYDGVSEPTTTESHLLMTKVDADTFEYSFDLTYGTPMYITFAKGSEAEITAYPDGFITATTNNTIDENLTSAISSKTSSYTRLYFNVENLDMTSQYLYIHAWNDSSNSQYQAYAYDKNNTVYYVDIDSSYTSFILVKQGSDGLTGNQIWDGKVWQSGNTNIVTSTPYYDVTEDLVSDEKSCTLTASARPSNILAPQYSTYFKLEIPSGSSTVTAYYLVDDHINYGDRNETTASSDGYYNYEFYNSTSLSLIKGTTFSAYFYNPITGAYENQMGYSSSETGTNGSSSLFTRDSNGLISINNNCQVTVYYKISLDTSGNVSSFGYWFSYEGANSGATGYTFKDSEIDTDSLNSATEFTLSSDGDDLNTTGDDSLVSENIELNGTSYYEKYVAELKDEGIITGTKTAISGTSNTLVYFVIDEDLISYLETTYPGQEFAVRAYTYYSQYTQNNNGTYSPNGVRYVDRNRYYTLFEELDNGLYVSTNLDDTKYFNRVSLSYNRYAYYFIQPQIVNAVTNEIYLMGDHYCLYNKQGYYLETNTVSTDGEEDYIYMGYYNGSSTSTTLNTGSYGTINNAIYNNYIPLSLNYVYVDISAITSDLNLCEVYLYDSTDTVLNANGITMTYDSETGFAYFDRSSYSTASYFKIIFNTFKTQVFKASVYVNESYQLVRNTANSEYEEYYYNGSAIDTSKTYIVSSKGTTGYLYSNDDAFNSNYYGTSSADDSLGLYTFTESSSFVLFTPNRTNAYSEVYYNIYDEADTLIGTLSYNESATLENQIQTFTGSILTTGTDTSYFYIKSTGDNPKVVGMFVVNNGGAMHYVTGTEIEILQYFYTSGGNTYYNRYETSVPVSNRIFATIDNSSATTDESDNYEYYLVGDFNNWRINEEYGINYLDGVTSGNNGYYYYTFQGIYLEAGQKFSVSNGTDYFAVQTGTFSNTSYDSEYDFDSSVITITPLDSSSSMGNIITVNTSGYYDLVLRYAKTRTNSNYSSSDYYYYYIGIKESTAGADTVDIYFQNTVGWNNVYINAWDEETGTYTIDSQAMTKATVPVDGSLNWYKYTYTYRYADAIPTKVYFSTTDTSTDYTKTIDLEFTITDAVKTSGSLFFTSNEVNGEVASNSERDFYLDISNLDYTDYKYVMYFSSSTDATKYEYIPFSRTSEFSIRKLTLSETYDRYQLIVMDRTALSYSNSASSDYVIYISSLTTLSQYSNYFVIDEGSSKSLNVTNKVANLYFTADSSVSLAAGYSVTLLDASDNELEVSVELKSGNILAFTNPNPTLWTKAKLTVGENTVTSTLVDTTNNYTIALSSSTLTLTARSYFSDYEAYVYNNSTPYLYYLRTSPNWSYNLYGLLFDAANDTFYADGISIPAGVGVRIYRYNGTPYTISTNIVGFEYNPEDPTSLLVNATALYTITTKVTSNTRTVELKLYTTTTYIMSAGLKYNVATVEVYDGSNNLVGSYSMNKGKNANIFYYDTYLESGYKLKLYYSNSITPVAEYTPTVEQNAVYRVSFAPNGGMDASVENPLFASQFAEWDNEYVKVSARSALTINFTPGAVYNGSYIQGTNESTDYLIEGSSYVINISEQSNLYYYTVGTSSTLNPLPWLRQSTENSESIVSIYSSMVFTSKFNEKITIYDEHKTAIGSINIVYPGAYFVYYCPEAIYKTAGTTDLVNITAIRIQGETTYHLVVDDKDYADFEYAYNGKYEEYTLDGTVAVGEDIDLTTNPLLIHDNNENVVAEVSSVTIYDYELLDQSTASVDSSLIIYDYSSFGDYNSSGAWFAVYLTNTAYSGNDVKDVETAGEGEWVAMYLKNDHYECSLTDTQMATYSYFGIFRMSSGSTSPSFDEVWNSSQVITLSEGKYIKVLGWDGSYSQSNPTYTYYVYKNGSYQTVSVTDLDPNTNYYTLRIYSTSTLPSGVYEVTYSLDNRRRMDDKYFVFTYLTFTVVPADSIKLYYYQSSTYNENETYYAAEVFIDTGVISGFDSDKAYYEITEATSFDPTKIYFVKNEDTNAYDEVKVQAFESGRTYYTIQKATTYDSTKTYYTYKFSEVVTDEFLDGITYYEYIAASTYDAGETYYTYSDGTYTEANPQPSIFEDKTYYVFKKTNTFIEGKTYYVLSEDESHYLIYNQLQLNEDLYTASRTSSSAEYDASASYYAYNDSTSTYDAVSSSNLQLKDNTYYVQSSAITNSSNYNSSSKYYTTTDNTNYTNSNVKVGQYYTLNSDNYITNVSEKSTASTYYYVNGVGNLVATSADDLIIKDGYYYLDDGRNNIALGSDYESKYYYLSDGRYVATTDLTLQDNTYYSKVDAVYVPFNDSATYLAQTANNNLIFTDSTGTTQIPSSEPIVGTDDNGNDYYIGYSYTGNTESSSWNDYVYTTMSYTDLYNFSYTALNTYSNANRTYFSFAFTSTKVIVDGVSYDLYVYDDSSYWGRYKTVNVNANPLSFNNYSSSSYFIYSGNYYYGTSQYNLTQLTTSNGSNAMISVRMPSAGYSAWSEANEDLINGYGEATGELFDSTKSYFTRTGNSSSGYTYTKVDSVNFTKTYYYKASDAYQTEFTTYASLLAAYNAGTTIYYSSNSGVTLTALSENDLIALDNTYYLINENPSSSTYDSSKTYLSQQNTNIYNILTTSDIEYSRNYYYSINDVKDTIYDSSLTYYSTSNNGASYQIASSVDLNDTYYTFVSAPSAYDPTATYYTYDAVTDTYKVATTVEFATNYYYDFESVKDSNGNVQDYDSTKSYFEYDSTNDNYTLSTNPFSDVTAFESGLYYIDEVIDGSTGTFIVGKEYTVLEENASVIASLDRQSGEVYTIVEFDIASKMNGYFTLEEATSYQSGHIYYAIDTYLTKVDDVTEAKFNANDYYEIVETYTSSSTYTKGTAYYTTDNAGESIYLATINLPYDHYYSINKQAATTYNPESNYVIYTLESIAVKIVDEETYSQPYQLVNAGLGSSSITYGYYGLYVQYAQYEEATSLISYEELGNYAPEDQEFKGWTTTFGSTTVEYLDGASVTITQEGEPLVLYPVFGTATYDVYISIGTGYTITDSNGTKLSDVSRELDESFSFKVNVATGYNSSTLSVTLKAKDGTDLTSYLSVSGDTYTIASSLKQDCYIIVSLEPNKYTINLSPYYDSDSTETFTLSSTTMEVKYGEFYTVEIPQDIKSGYSFTGWYWEDTLMTDADGRSLYKWSTITNDTITFEAHFTNIYTLNVVAIDENNNVISSLTSTYTESTTARFIVNTALAGYSYQSFTITNATSEESMASALSSYTSSSSVLYTFDMPGANVNVVIRYQLETYTISYLLNGGSVDGENPTTFNVNTESFTLINPTRSGYKFTGWSGTDTALSTSVTIAQGSTGSRSFIANWEAERYTVSYSYSVPSTLISSISNTNVRAFTINNGTITLVAPTLSGYTFIGWYTDSTLSTPVTTISYLNGNVSLYGYFEETLYTFFSAFNAIDPDSPLHTYLANNLGGDYVYVSIFTNESGSSYYFVNDDSLAFTDSSQAYQIQIPKQEYIYVYHAIVHKDSVANMTFNEYLPITDSSFECIVYNSDKIQLNTIDPNNTNHVVNAFIWTGIKDGASTGWNTAGTLEYNMTSLFYYVTYYDGLDKTGAAITQFSFNQDELVDSNGNPTWSLYQTIPTMGSIQSMTWAVNEAVNAGIYFALINPQHETVTVENAVDDGTYDFYTDMKVLVFVVQQQIYDVSNITLESEYFVRDGGEKSLSISGSLPSGVSVTYEYYAQDQKGEENPTPMASLPSAVGTYYVKAIFSVEDSNYATPDSLEAVLIIYDETASYYENADLGVSGYFYLIVNNRVEGILSYRDSTSYYISGFTLEEGDNVYIKSSNGNNYLIWTNSDIPDNYAFEALDDGEYAFFIDLETAEVTVTYDAATRQYSDAYVFVNGERVVTSRFYKNTSFVSTDRLQAQYLTTYEAKGGEHIGLYYLSESMIAAGQDPVGINEISGDYNEGEEGNSWYNWQEIGLASRTSDLILKYPGTYKFTLYFYSASSFVYDCVVEYPDVPVYVTVPSTYSSVNAYFWGDSNTSMTSWPGEAMTEVTSMATSTTKTYTVNIPYNANYIIFNYNNGSGTAQTSNLTYSFASGLNYWILNSDNTVASNISWINYSKAKNVYTIDATIVEDTTDPTEIASIAVEGVSGTISYDSSTKQVTVTSLDEITFDSTGSSYGSASFKVTITYGAAEGEEPASYEYIIEYNSDGSEDNPILIASSADFTNSVYNASFAETEGLYYLQTASSIDVASASKPYTRNISFAGIYDGNNNTIQMTASNIVDGTNTEHTGLLGYIDEGGVIKNVTINVIYPSVSGNVGTSNSQTTLFFSGSVASINLGTIDNVTLTSPNTITMWAEEYVGGYVGSNYGTISNCTSHLKMIFYDWGGNNSRIVGGIAGYNEGTISSCSIIGESSDDTLLSDGGKTNSYYFGLVSGIENGTVTNFSYTGDISRENDLAGSKLYGAVVKGTISVKPLANWWLDHDLENNTFGSFYVDYYSGTDWKTNFAYACYTSCDINNFSIYIFENTDNIVIGWYETSYNQPIIDGSFSDKAKYETVLTAGQVSSLLATSGTQLLIVPHGTDATSTYTTSTYVVNKVTQSVAGNVTVIDKSSTFSEGNIMRVYNYNSSDEVIAINEYEVGATVDTDIKIYDGATKLVITKLVDSTQANREEVATFTINSISTQLDLYLYNSTGTWGYDASLTHYDILATELIKSSYSDDLVSVDYYNSSDELITTAKYEVDSNGNFTLHVYLDSNDATKNATKFVIYTTTDSGTYVRIEVAGLTDSSTFTFNRLYYWYSYTSNRSSYVISDERIGESNTSVTVVSSFTAYNTSKLYAIHYDSNDEVFAVDAYNANNASTINAYADTAKILLTQYGRNGNLYEVTFDYTSALATSKRIYLYNTVYPSSVTSNTIGMHAEWINPSLTVDTQIKLFTEVTGFSYDGAKIGAITYDSDGNVIMYKSYNYSVQTLLDIYDGASKIEIVRLLSDGDYDSYLIDLSDSTESTPNVKLDEDGNVEWVDANYVPVIATFDIINQIEDWVSTTEEPYDTVVEYYNASTVEFKTETYSTASQMHINVYLGTSFMRIKLVSQEDSTVVKYALTISSVSTTQKLYLVNDLSGTPTGVWANTPSTVVYSIIPIVYDENLYSSYRVYYYLSNGILITSYSYNGDEDAIEYIENTAQIKVVATLAGGEGETDTFTISNFSLSKSLHFGIDSEGNGTLTWGDNAAVDSLYRVTVHNDIDWWFDNGALTKVYYYSSTGTLLTVDTYESDEEIQIRIYQGTSYLQISRLVDDIEETYKTTVNSIQRGYILRLASPATGYVSASWIVDTNATETVYIYLKTSDYWASTNENTYRYAIYYQSSDASGWEEMSLHEHSSLYRASWSTIISENPTSIIFCAFNEEDTTNSLDTAVYRTDVQYVNAIDITTANEFVLTSTSAGSFATYYKEFTTVYFYVSQAVLWPSYYVRYYGDDESEAITSPMTFSNDMSAYYANIYADMTAHIEFASSFSDSVVYKITTGYLTGYTEEAPMYALYSMTNKLDESYPTVHGEWVVDKNSANPSNYTFAWYLVGGMNSWSTGDATYGMSKIGESTITVDGNNYITDLYYCYLNVESATEFKVVRTNSWDISYGYNNNLEEGWAVDSTEYIAAQFDGANLSVASGKYVIVFEVTQTTTNSMAKPGGEVVDVSGDPQPLYCCFHVMTVTD